MATSVVGPFREAGGDVQNVTIQLRDTATAVGLSMLEVEEIELHAHYVRVQWTQVASGDVKTAVVPWSNIVAITQVVDN